MKAAFLDFDTVSNGDLDTSALSAAVDELRLFDSDDTQIGARIHDVEAVLLNKAELSRQLIQDATALELIAVAGTGTNHIDMVAARERGVAVCNVRGYCTLSVTQHVWGLILSLTQHLSEYGRLTGDGSWTRNERVTALSHPIRELQGRIFGVVGWGELGRGAARIAAGFGMRVVIANRRGRPPTPGRMELDELLAVADVVSLHCPLTDSTRGMLGRREFSLMKPGALLINTARGGLVDGHALADALKAGRLAGAGIDVLTREPPLEDDPLLDSAIPNLIVTPHVAWAAREARQRCLDEMAANIKDFREGGRRSRVV